jgi:hypothetical protein
MNEWMRFNFPFQTRLDVQHAESWARQPRQLPNGQQSVKQVKQVKKWKMKRKNGSIIFKSLAVKSSWE